MLLPSQFGFYAILTEPKNGYESCTRILVDAGIKFVQLRIKDRPKSSILPIAEKMRTITENSDTFFIVNDFPDIAYECGADGVHIGQEDRGYHDVRAIVGTDAIVGLSTHNASQTESACTFRPDYIGIGPVFPTVTKKIPDPTIGITGMISMLKKASVPAVAIGGIDLSNIRSILDAGALNFCMVRQFTQSCEPEKIVRAIMKIYRSYYPDF